MSVTAAELQENLNKYLLLAATEEVFVTLNGKIIAKISNPNQDRLDIVEALSGIIPDDISLEDAHVERLGKI